MRILRNSQVFWRLFTKTGLLLFVLMVQMSVSDSIWARVNCPPQGPRLSADQYCKLYAAEAQRQMKLYGIPASITLAQGMYESAYGSSYLAVKANNHFGIKAYHGWNGPVVKCDDDTHNEPFCKFSSVAAGYEYHSKFLRNNTRYSPLFKLDIRDYEAWAKGLRSCGYATNPRYADQLISIIERYHLDAYDVIGKNGKGTNAVSHHKLYSTAKRRGLKYVRAEKNDDLSIIAREFKVTRRQLRNWNDLPRKYQLKEGDVIYLQAKRNRAGKAHRTHEVKAGESLQSISQRYGVTVKSLMKRNKLESGSVKAGQVLKLR